MKAVVIAATSLIVLTGCVYNTPSAPPPTQVVIPPAQNVTLIPNAPPPANAELVPPPPQGAMTAVWQPGHWAWTGNAGNPWSWAAGQYVTPPPGHSQWVQGRWTQYPNGWSWTEGHWA
jgi:hypothetical protein